MLLSLVVFLFSCNRKGEEWLLEHQEEIKSATQTNDFFVPNEAVLNEKKLLLEGFQKDLDEVAYYEIESSEAVAILKDLQSKIEEAVSYINKYTSKAGNYQIAKYLRNQYEGDTSDLVNFYKKINETLIHSDSFYISAQANLETIKATEGQATVQQHFYDFHWLSDTLAVNVRESNVSETLKSELLMNIQMTQLYIKDYIGFVNSFIYNTSDTTNILEETPNVKIEQ